MIVSATQIDRKKTPYNKYFYIRCDFVITLIVYIWYNYTNRNYNSLAYVNCEVCLPNRWQGLQLHYVVKYSYLRTSFFR